MTLAILLIVLVIATSFIAYWADNLGKKLGKKRISLFGIRPKQTATLISVGSSVAIMLLTVGVLLATFSNLRNALLRYDTIRHTALELQSKNNELIQNNKGLLGQQDTLNLQLSSLKEESTQAQKQRAAAMTQLTKIQADLKRASSAEKLARQGEKAAKAKANTASAQYAQIAQKLYDAQKKVASSQKLLAQSLNKLQSTNISLAKTNKDFKAAQKQLGKAQLQLVDANTQLQRSQENLATVQRNFALVDQQVRSTLDQYREAARNVERLKKRSDNLETALKTQQQQLYELSTVANKLATGDVDVAYGTVFAQTLIPSKTSAAIVNAQLQTLLKAGKNAVQGKYDLYLAQLNTEMQGDQIIDYLAAQLSSSDVTMSVRLVAARDHATGETDISTRFILVPVRTIFQKGEVIEEGQIESDAGDALIFNQLLRLIDEGEAKARGKGSLPITTHDSPFYAAGTNERIFEALRQIQSHSGSVTVKMIASENITTIDSLPVKFIVTDSPSS